MNCQHCRHDIPDAARFCPNCGSPAPASTAFAETTEVAAPPVAPVDVHAGRRTSIAPFVVTAIVVGALVLGGLAIVTAQNGSDTDEVASDVSAASTDPSSTAASSTNASSTTELDSSTTSSIATTTTDATTTTTTTSTTTSTSTLPPDPRTVALEAIDSTIAADRPSVDLLVGSWVPQVSAKREFEDWEGIIWGLPEILDLHRSLDDAHGAVLVSGSEYHFFIGDRRMSDYYFTFVDRPFGDAQGALDWCADAGIDRDNCAARFISNGPTGSPMFVLQ